MSGEAGMCWRHDYAHREYECRCDPPVWGDTGRDDLDQLWEAAKDAATQHGTTIGAVIRDALARFVHDVNCGCEADA